MAQSGNSLSELSDSYAGPVDSRTKEECYHGVTCVSTQCKLTVHTLLIGQHALLQKLGTSLYNQEDRVAYRDHHGFNDL